jgi:hypothetical protein
MDYLELKSRITKSERSGGITNAHTKRALIRLKRIHDQRAEAGLVVDRRIQIQHVGGMWINVRVNDQSTKDQNIVSQGYHLIERRWAKTNTPLRDGEKITALKLINKLRGKLMSSDPHELTPDGEVTDDR